MYDGMSSIPCLLSRLPLYRRRDGDPIADQFAVRLYPNGSLFVLADGCGWGSRSRRAAATAVTGICEVVEAEMNSFSNLQDVARAMLTGLHLGHSRIWDGVSATWEVGTTTALIGMLVKTTKGDKNGFGSAPYVLICLNIGDCKAFVSRRQAGDIVEVLDMTVESKRTVREKSDPGGRIGPYDEGQADVRNLLFSMVGVWPEDYITLVSDGVHDNLDPETLGKSLDFSLKRNPHLARQVFKLEVDDANQAVTIPEAMCTNAAWESIAIEQGELLKAEYREHMISNFITSNQVTKPSQLVDILFTHCKQSTHASRNFMETNQNKSHPPDYVTYPGKMDHTTAIVYRVTDSLNTETVEHNDEEELEGDKKSRKRSAARLTHTIDPLNPKMVKYSFYIRKETATKEEIAAAKSSGSKKHGVAIAPEAGAEIELDANTAKPARKTRKSSKKSRSSTTDPAAPNGAETDLNDVKAQEG